MITLDKAFFVTDFRYTEQAAAQAQGFEIVKNVGPIFDEVAKICQQEEINALAFEESHVSFAEYSVLEEIIEETPLVPVKIYGKSKMIRKSPLSKKPVPLPIKATSTY